MEKSPFELCSLFKNVATVAFLRTRNPLRLNIALVLVLMWKFSLAHSRMFNLPQVLLSNNSFNNEMFVFANPLMFCPSLAEQASLCSVRFHLFIRCSKSRLMIYTRMCNLVREDRNGDFQAAASPSSPYRCVTASSWGLSRSLALFNNSWAVADQGYCLMTDWCDLPNQSLQRLGSIICRIREDLITSELEQIKSVVIVG